MSDSLSIRAYTPVLSSHNHEFHQIVLPLHGEIEMNIEGDDGVVCVGQSVIILKGLEHSFKAREQSRFLVADLEELPENVRSHASPFATISNSMMAYCGFVDIQLQSQTSVMLEKSMLEVFKQLLSTQDFAAKINMKISRALAYIENNINEDCSLDVLASKANLSASHFKVEFKKQTGKSSSEYLMMRRMEKARSLLTHTDFPVQLIAEKVGYINQSAFSRRFSAYFGESPLRFKSR